MMHITYSPISTNFLIPPYFCKIYKLPCFRSIYVSLLNLHFWLPPILTMMHLGAVHKVRHAILDQFDSLPLSHFVTHLGTLPLKYVTHLGAPEFLVVHAYIHMSLQGVVLVRGGF